MRRPERIIGPPAGVSRRQMLQAAALGLAVPVASGLAGCSFGSGQPDAPDPLIALADQARSDAALATAAAATSPDLATRLTPLATARRAHAAALEQEISRIDPQRSTLPSTTPSAPASTGPVAAPALPGVLDALTVSARDAAAAVPGLPAERVGLVASVAACCAAYRVVLG